MPTFCRHNRFLERCPICSKDLPGSSSPAASRRAGGARGAGGAGPGRVAGQRSSAVTGRRNAREGVRVRREGRAQDDGYRSELAPGLRASVDAERLSEEIAFAGGRLQALAAQPPGLYGELRAGGDPEAAIWGCLLTAYLCPLETAEPFAAIAAALEALPRYADADSPQADELLDGLALGPRSSHSPGRGAHTLRAYGHWVGRAGGSQAQAFAGDAAWVPERRFERVFERLAVPGLTRTARYELLVLLGRLGLADLRADSLQLRAQRGGEEDATTAGAKRVFGIGEPLLLERRAHTLAEQVSVPIESLDLALWNWASSERATLGFAASASDAGALERARRALGL